jgi:unsaturated rhamnogalacturonyl hydrolase
VWGFGEAIALRGLLRTGDAEHFGFVHGLLRSWLGRGAGRTFEDHVAPGSELLTVYERTGDPELLAAATRLAGLHASFPCGPGGARLHRPDQPGWRSQIWVDCMDMDGPFLARLGRVTGEEQYVAQAAEQALGYARLLQTEDGLLRHGFEASAGPNGQLWARGNGWGLMGLVDTLASLPASAVGVDELRQRLSALARRLGALQDPSGLWRTVVDRPDSPLETTLAAMASYGFREAFRAGLLPRTEFEAVERRAAAAVLAHVGADGVLQRVTEATPVGEYHVYATRQFGVYPWGQGALLLMLTESE